MTPSPSSQRSKVWRQFVIASVCATVLLLVTAASIGWLLHVTTGRSFNDILLVQLSLCCALLSWSFVFLFHFRRESMAIPTHDRDHSLSSIAEHLENMKYITLTEGDDLLVAYPEMTSFLLGGKIKAHVVDQTIHLRGPKITLEQLRNRLRFDTFVMTHQDSQQQKAMSLT